MLFYVIRHWPSLGSRISNFEIRKAKF
jgi:hypothetical protein